MNNNSWIAFALSFILPGAGLVYLGHHRIGLLNFMVAQVILLVMLLALTGDSFAMEHFHYLVLAVHAASAGFTRSYAKSTSTT